MNGEGFTFDFHSLFIYPGGVILQVLALVHAVRRRPEGYWFLIILIGGGLGALAYFAFEILPDIQIATGNLFAGANRKGRIQQLETKIVDNPSPANFEELGELYWEQKEYARARDAFDKSITARSDSLHTFYHRALCSLALGDMPRAMEDLETVVGKKQDFDYHRAAALLAHCYGRAGKAEAADAWFQEATIYSTTPESLFHYAWFLQQEKRDEEARQWAQKVLDKKKTLPRWMQRSERAWFLRAKAMLKELAQPKPSGV